MLILSGVDHTKLFGVDLLTLFGRLDCFALYKHRTNLTWTSDKFLWIGYNFFEIILSVTMPYHIYDFTVLTSFLKVPPKIRIILRWLCDV
jgi:hypothetical protein